MKPRREKNWNWLAALLAACRWLGWLAGWLAGGQLVEIGFACLLGSQGWAASRLAARLAGLCFWEVAII